MKKILSLIILFSNYIFAQQETDCPFAPQKYVHYDGKIESSSSYLPSQYQQLLQNNHAYDREVDHLSSSAKATCFYKTSIHNHDSIKKPFVFVEGISFEKKSIADNEYNMGDYFKQEWAPIPPPTQLECLTAFNSAPQYQGTLVGYSTFNWATLVTGIDAEGYHVGDPLKVEKSPELLNQLCCAGYDICFVDFHSGEAYIESNGEALYSILVQLHQQLVDNNSTEKMVVCGASMGGLVARYAINKLEAEGHTDWVEKFVSFDSPQMGANIPLGIQYTLKHLKGLNSDVQEKYNKLTCPSASQLVNYSCLETNLSSPINYTTPSPSIERTELISNPYMGWPQYCTKVSISNGSRNGTPQSISHQPGDQVLDVDGVLDIDLFSLPQNDNNYQKVFDFDLPICLVTQAPALMALGITQQSVRVKNTMALDLAAGSFRKDLQEIETSLPNITTNWFGQASSACGLNWTVNPSNSNKLCFIPIMSSIGAISYENLMKNTSAFSQAVLTAAFDGDAKFEDYNHQFSHFDVVYAPENNQSHVEITDENISWLMQELTGMEDVIWHENKPLISNTFKAQNHIMAGNNIFQNPICDQPNNNAGGGVLVGNGGNALEQSLHCGDVNVLSNHAVYYKAGNFVSLEPGFNTQDNAFFQAEIINIPFCNSGNRMSNSGVAADGNAIVHQTSFENKNTKNNLKGLETLNNSVNIFPNPSNSYCEISSTKNIELITINSVMGTLIHREQVNQYNYKLNTTELPNGVYLVTVKTEGEHVIKKVVVKHD